MATTANAASAGTIVLVDDDDDLRALLERRLGRAGFTVHPFSAAQPAIDHVARQRPDCVLLDLHLDDGLDGEAALAALRRQHGDLPVVVLTADDDVSRVVQVMQAGAFDYLVKPVEQTRLETTLRNAIRHERLSDRLRTLEAASTQRGDGIVGASAAIEHVRRRIAQVAPTDITVIIQGETGTGKELVARALHAHSPRRAQPFVAINCAAVPETLQESELFGHERGAFTGASARRAGCFERADGGTLFLDEAAELAPGLQAKLLRVLQERRFTRVGGDEEVAVDVRIVWATRASLHEEVERGRLRDDLYYRMAVFEIDVPPLRDRGDDVLLIAAALLDDLRVRYDRPVLRLGASALSVLQTYPWPGNVRELQHALECAAVVAEDKLEGHHFPRRVREAIAMPADDTPAPRPPFAGWTLAEAETWLIHDAWRRHHGHAASMAADLDVPRTTLYRKLKSLGLSGSGRGGD